MVGVVNAVTVIMELVIVVAAPLDMDNMVSNGGFQHAMR